MNSEIKATGKIAISTLCSGDKSVMQMFTPHSLHADGTAMSCEEQMAIISHYLHNQGQGYAKKYEESAKGLMAALCRVCQKHAPRGRDSDVCDPFSLFSDLFCVPFLPPARPTFTFIDLFAGIGGFRMAMQNLGGKCIYSSEWDKQAQKTYLLNYGEVPFGDITKETTKSFIPDNFIIGVSDASAYKQFGNSVAVPAIQATAKEIVKVLLSNDKYSEKTDCPSDSPFCFNLTPKWGSE